MDEKVRDIQEVKENTEAGEVQAVEEAEEVVKAERIRELLAHCTGSERVYPHLLGVRFTEGVKLMADECGAYWLIDLIASHQFKKHVRREPFQVWELRQCKTSPSWKAVCTDGNDNRITGQRIEYSSFPLPEGIKLYCCDGVILLPSEY